MYTLYVGVSPTPLRYRDFAHRMARCFTHAEARRLWMDTSFHPRLSVDGHVISPTPPIVISPTRTPRKASNGGGLKNRNARARFLTYKIFNAEKIPRLWISLSQVINLGKIPSRGLPPPHPRPTASRSRPPVRRLRPLPTLRAVPLSQTQ